MNEEFFTEVTMFALRVENAKTPRFPSLNAKQGGFPEDRSSFKWLGWKVSDFLSTAVHSPITYAVLI